MRLAALGPKCPRVLILERRVRYSNDRTWCFWGDSSSVVENLIGHSWSTVKVRTPLRQVSVNCSGTPYQTISGEAFYQAALNRISEAGQIDLVLNAVPLAEPSRIDHHWRLDTSEGMFQGKMIVDTRPGLQPRAGGALLWQSFSGQEIECDDDVFDPSSVDLMDFTGVKAGRVDFSYVVPFSRNRALIEATVFGPDPVGPHDLAIDLQNYIARRVRRARFRVLRSENGILPMGSVPSEKRLDATYIRAGLTAGGARASTGYAFQRIQSWADQCARSIAEGRLPVSHKSDPLVLQSLDYLFISVIRSHPEIAPSLFLSLFENTQPERMIRFLSDSGNLSDYAAIACALPVAPFLREIPTAMLRKLNQLMGRVT